MTVWPNGSRRIPDVSVEWMGYPGHYGIDLINFDLNCASQAARVVYSSWNPSGAGNEVRIQAANGDIFRMLHNASLLVGFNENVVEGQPCGVQGSTGDSTGKHCHFEVWPGGNINNRLNPRTYMAAAIPAGGDITPIDETIKDEDMTYGIRVTVISNPDPLQGNVPLNARFIGSGTDPLVWVLNTGPEEKATVPVVFVEWDTAAVAERIRTVGLRGAGKDLKRVMYAFGKFADEVGTSSTGTVTVDNTAVLTAVSNVDAKVSTLPTLPAINSAIATVGTAIIAGVKGMFGKAAS